jgi:hypothetical protein
MASPCCPRGWRRSSHQTALRVFRPWQTCNPQGLTAPAPPQLGNDGQSLHDLISLQRLERSPERVTGLLQDERFTKVVSQYFMGLEC